MGKESSHQQEVRKIHTVTMMMGTNYVSRGDFRKMTQWPEKVSCLLQEARIYLDPTVLTTCTVPYNMMLYGNGLSMNERVRHISGIKLEIQGSGVLPSLKSLQVASMMEEPLPAGCSSYSINFDQPRGVERLIRAFQKHDYNLKSDLLETGQFIFGPLLRPRLFPVGPVRGTIDYRDTSASSRCRQPGSISLKKDTRGSSTPQSSVVSSVVVVERGNENKSSGEALNGTSKARYPEKIRDLDLTELACRLELIESLELKRLSHEGLIGHD